MKPHPRTVPLVIVLLFTALHGFGDDLYYRSNDFGMLLARIPSSRRDDSRWVLQVSRGGLDEVRRLFDNGVEVKRWDFTWNREGSERVERQTAAGVLSARRVYAASGSLLQEEEYTAGVLSKKSLFTYVNGRLSRSRTLAGADESPISSEVYLYAANGGLREVRRTVPLGTPLVSSVVASTVGLSEARSAMGGSLFIERYDTEGRLIYRERREDGTSVSTEDFSYGPGSRKLASSEERLPLEHAVVTRGYDGDGRLARETTSVNGSVRVTIGYERDAKGNVTSKTSRGIAGSESWKYTRSESGDLSREEYFQRGILVKVTTPGEGKLRTEELYKDGELFLKIFFDGDTRLREEVYLNGSLQRERSYP